MNEPKRPDGYDPEEIYADWVKKCQERRVAEINRINLKNKETIRLSNRANVISTCAIVLNIIALVIKVVMLLR